MAKKLIKLGNSYALIIDKAFLNQLKIGPDTKVEMMLDDHGQCLRVYRESLVKELYEAAKKRAEEKADAKAMLDFMQKVGKVVK